MTAAGRDVERSVGARGPGDDQVEVVALAMGVRLDGTNAEEGRAILAESAPPNLYVEPTMLDAARKAVELAA